MKIKAIITVVVLFIASLLFFNLLSTCKKKPTPQPGAQSFKVIPNTDPVTLANLPELPNNEKPVAAIVVPLPTPKVGHVLQPAVVVSDAGNTFVVYSDRIDCGLRFEPKAAVGISTDLLLGVDVTFFTWWRLNADALLFVPVKQDFNLCGGLGVSYQVLPNTSAGVACLLDLENQKTWSVFVAIKF